MRVLALVLSISYCFISSRAYRDGAREESCYNHRVVHERAIVTDCGANCRFFLTVKGVVNEATLELGNETNSYECGKIYGIEVDNDLNAPEGYLVQARDGTEDSSEIIGTFLDRSTVQERNPSVPLNFKILQCRRSMSSTGELLDNSATHPDTVNMAGTLQLYWQAPNCSDRDLPNVTLWFTIVQQLTVVYNPSKSTVLTYIPPPPPPTTTSAPTTTTESSTTTLAPTTSSTTPTPDTTTDKSQPMSGESVGPLSMGAIIGIAVGGGSALLIVIFIIIIAVMVYRRKRRTSGSKREKYYASGSNAEFKAHDDSSHRLGKVSSEDNGYVDVVPMDASVSTFKT